jgi:outer membrane protein OmpA-like peptidoglycan-associated protein
MKAGLSLRLIIPVVLFSAAVLPALPQDGKLKIHVTPRQAYVFVDGHAMAEASKHVLRLSPGTHKLDLHNYGYKTASQDVSIKSGEMAVVNVTLEPIPAEVPGPRGCITIEGADRDAVLLNGKTPEFFVGHGDEFNHEWLWKQELIVPPGKHQFTVLNAEKEIWSDMVDVPENQRVVVDIPKGVRKTVPWHRGEKLASLARFRAGIASAMVAVAKPVAQLSASNVQVNCGQGTQLNWTSADAPHVEISSLGPVASSGEKMVQPKQTITYQLTASGPGGAVTSNATVEVNRAIQAQLIVSPAEIRYKRVGDQIIDNGSATLNWSTANASAVVIQSVGDVSSTGSRVLQLAPRNTNEGAVDETVTYTLTATNPCGATETRTATAHLVGSIESAKLGLRSLYFATNQPRTTKPARGLFMSQQKALMALAEQFEKYRRLRPDAQLILDGHADRRGPQHYNQLLSERRATVAKQFLVEHGLPAANIETRAHGYRENLNSDTVRQLLDQHTELTAAERQQLLTKLHTLVLANNRRVDVTLKTTGEDSARLYPFKDVDFSTLFSRGTAIEKRVEVRTQERAK